ncbi:MAG: hypothetical protein DLM54_11490 [Acidimicrobiales bacterium]|nr:MAG: hypothetical protein DLM54_11490 [Acidimicrobiales bacterium]
MGEIIEFPSNGSTGQGWLALPARGSGPGVVVIQEWWGLVDHITDVCERLAGEGFVALAPDLYQGETTDEPDDAQKKMMALRLDEAAKNMSGAVDAVHQRSSGAGVGVVGFCMGGGLALVLATQRPDLVRAVVPFYGLVPWPDVEPDYRPMSAGLQGHYAEDDDSAGPQAAHDLEETLTGMGKEAEVFIYPGAHHGFFNDSRPEQYAPEASRLAWGRTVAFLRSHLA